MPPQDTDTTTSSSRTRATIVAVGAAVGLTFAGLGVAAAQTDSSTPSTTTPTATDDTDAAHQGHRGRSREAELTGDTAQRVQAAALEAVPGGTILRLETDADGAYEAHVRSREGDELVVAVDENYRLTGTEAHRGGRRGGSKESGLTGETAERVQAAALEAVPGGTILRLEADAEGAYEAHVRDADGNEIDVAVDESFEVTATEPVAEEGRGRRHGGDHADDDEANS